MSDDIKEEIIPEEENMEEIVEAKEEKVEEKKVAIPVVKPHMKFHQQQGYNAWFGGRGNKFWNASVKRMGKGAQRGR